VSYLGLVDKIKGFMNAPDDEYYEDEPETPVRKRRSDEDNDDYFGYDSSPVYKKKGSRAPSYSSDVSDDSFDSGKREKDYFYDDTPRRQSGRDRETTRSGRDFGSVREQEKNKVVNIHATTQLQVVLVKPERFDEATTIADHLNAKRTVLLNLEAANRELTRRLVDFLSGVAYANNGQLKKVANMTFIITPFDVDIMGDLLMDELENNGFYL
jgi:cell division inhibitor SepF